MQLKPTTRQFLMAAGGVTVGLAVMLGHAAWRTFSLTGGDAKGTILGILVNGAYVGLALVLGIAFAYFRMVRDRKARANRKPPLSM